MQMMIDQTDIRRTQMGPQPNRALEDAEARVALRRCALTANNVTYAAAGFDIGYWQFFPSGVDGWGIVPVWGTAEVVETRSDALEIGARLYGFYPMAEELVTMRDPVGAARTKRKEEGHAHVEQWRRPLGRRRLWWRWQPRIERWGRQQQRSCRWWQQSHAEEWSFPSLPVR